MKLVAPALLVLSSVSCQNTTAPAFNYATDVGIALEKAESACLYISNGTLSPGQRVRFVTPSTPPNAVEAEIVRREYDKCKDPYLDRVGSVHYSFKTVQGGLRHGDPAFAIPNFTRPLTPTEEGVMGDLEGDGKSEYFRSCTSTEGVHLTVWKGKPLTGQRKWHSYYYLGYDVISNCTESETKPDAER